MTSQLPVLTVTVNPALDIYTHVPRLSPQVKLRCSVPRIDPGGGGVNVSRVIHQLGGTSTAFMALGGATGAQLAELVSATGIEARVFSAEGETRTSFTVMEDAAGQHFRFVLPGPQQHSGSKVMAESIADLAPAGGIVVLSGSLLPGLPEDFYGQLILRIRASGALTILDAHGAALRAAVPSRPDILRLNHIEAAELLGARPTDNLRQLGEMLKCKEVAGTVIVSQGADGTVVASDAGVHWIRPPRVEVRSSVGAGDSFVGAFTFGLARSYPLVEAARLGVAAASSAVMAEGTGLCEREETEKMVSLTSVEDLTPAVLSHPIMS